MKITPLFSAKGASAGPTQSSSSMASTKKSSQVQCHKCTGLGHFARDCTIARVIVALGDGGYDSASDYDEETLALIAHEEQCVVATHHEDAQYMAAEDAEKITNSNRSACFECASGQG
jgi:hypothetical protein